MPWLSHDRHVPTILKSAPYFPVADVAVTAAAYGQVFGFATAYIAGSPPEFAICSRDGHAIMFRRVAASERIVPNESQGGAWDVFFWVDDADSLHAELAARGADVVYEPTDQTAYGMREFAVRDLNGYVLGFGQTIAS